MPKKMPSIRRKIVIKGKKYLMDRFLEADPYTKDGYVLQSKSDERVVFVSIPLDVWRKRPSDPDVQYIQVEDEFRLYDTREVNDE